MKNKNILLSILIFFTSISCQEYKKLENGILIRLKKKTKNDTRLIKIQFITDNIIHVAATPDKSFSNKKSLVIIDKKITPIKWKIEQKKDRIIIYTASLQAQVSLCTGEITFTNSIGQKLLVENQGGGKTFIPLKITNKKNTYKIRQVFESPSDEAFYGLGQHQYALMNYKGKDIDLFQYNTKISIPFVISNKKYGILWDNYSYSKFGDIRDYESLSKLKLYSMEKLPVGLTTIYSDLEEPDKIFIKRIESDIDYAFDKDLRKFPEAFPFYNSMVKWTGFIEADTTIEYKFQVYSSGYIKIWFNEKLIIDRWRQSWNPSFTFFNFPMEKGKKYPIKIEWIPDRYKSYISLKCLEELPLKEKEKISFFSEIGKQIDYYFIKGESMDQVINGYRHVTGKAPIMPKWAFGLWQSRERYKTQDELLSVVEQFRKLKIPIDNIVLDWEYWKNSQWGSHEFDSSRFPDPAGMVDKLHNELNTHIMISVWPKFDTGTKNYKIMNDKGFLFNKNAEQKNEYWMNNSFAFYDAFNPKARKLFWMQINEKLAKKGFDAWWLDASEPEIQGNLSIEERKAIMNPTALGNADEYLNAYPLVNAEGIYSGLRKTYPDQRVFILTRSGFAGLQRYAVAVWSGDIGARWEEMKLQIPAGINFCLSGIPYWTMDIGGFSVEKRFEYPDAKDMDEWRELMVRWIQFGAFVPIFRVHGQFPYREIFNIAPENHPVYNIILQYDKLRYRLMPYIYSLAGMVYLNDYTIMRGLIMDFPNDTSVQNIKDQYMFGQALMICPVYEFKARNRKVYLPAKIGWFDLYTGKFFEGGQTTIADASIDKIPIFVKEGSIIPFGPEIEYSTQTPADPITLYVYTGKNVQYNIYEDENINYNYEKGMFSIIPISYNEQSRTLIINTRKGSFPGMLKERTFNIIFIDKVNPKCLNFDNKPDITIKYYGNTITLKLN